MHSVKGKRVKVGEIIGGKLFRKKVKKSRHFFASARAWGIDKNVFDRFIQHGCTHILLKCIETKTLISTTVGVFARYAWRHQWRDFQSQYFLNEQHWREIEKESEEDYLARMHEKIITPTVEINFSKK